MYHSQRLERVVGTMGVCFPCLYWRGALFFPPVWGGCCTVVAEESVVLEPAFEEGWRRYQQLQAC